jgi:CubicO group peptidase (beta-lactamase class C family)
VYDCHEHAGREEDRMRRLDWPRSLPLAGLALAVLTSCAGSAAAAAPVDHSLAGVLRRTLVAHHLPAIAGAVVRGDSITGIAALGARKLGAPGAVTLADRFHLGSNVKAMTADLLAMEVEAGHLAWDRTLAQIFPEFADSMRAEYRGVTLAALLQHRSGLPRSGGAGERTENSPFTGTLEQRRRAFAHWLLRQAPGGPVGQYLYSNAGYALAGAILERSAGASWESLVQTRLWAPLGFAGGFGWPAAGGAPQPWGHYGAGPDGLVPQDPDDPGGRFPDLIRPAGEADLAIGDYARFARLHLRALRGHPELLSAASFRRLHAANGTYAMGWNVLPVGGATAWVHAGSNATFAAVAMIQPDRDIAVVVLTNAGSADAIQAAQSAAAELLGN